MSLNVGHILLNDLGIRGILHPTDMMQQGTAIQYVLGTKKCRLVHTCVFRDKLTQCRLDRLPHHVVFEERRWNWVSSYEKYGAMSACLSVRTMSLLKRLLQGKCTVDLSTMTPGRSSRGVWGEVQSQKCCSQSYFDNENGVTRDVGNFYAHE